MSQIKIKMDINFLQNKHLINGYSDNYILVDNNKITFPLIVTGELLITAPDLKCFDWSIYEVIIVAKKTDGFELNIKFIPKNHEQMNFQAACRTYNILLSEGRKVVLFIG